jgi:hypothetical protein
MERLENEILEDISSNETLLPILECIEKPINLRLSRALLQHLPTMAIQKRDDHIFGAARFLANSLGITILDTTCNESVDPPMKLSKRNEIWRQAKFYCRCMPDTRYQHDIGKRAFCESCSFLITHEISELGDNICRGCNTNEWWKDKTQFCLSCQLATIVYRNPFQKRFNAQLEYWLSMDDTSNDTTSDPRPHQLSQTKSPKTPQPSTQDMLRCRTLSIERSYQTIKSRGSTEQTRFIFENLSILQQDIQSNCSHLKRDFETQTSTSLASEITDENLSPRKRCSLNRKLFDEQSSNMKTRSRPPLLPIDMNSRTYGASSLTKGKECATIGSTRRKKQERNLKMKEQKSKDRNEKA